MPKERTAPRRERDGGEWTPTGAFTPHPTVDPPEPREGAVTKSNTACPECGAVVSSKSMKRHIREQHSSDAYACRFCTFRTKRPEGADRHEQAHHADKLAGDVKNLDREAATATTQEPEVRGGADSAEASTSRRSDSPPATRLSREEAPLMPTPLQVALTCALPPSS